MAETNRDQMERDLEACTVEFHPDPNAYSVIDPHFGLENLPDNTRISMPLFLYRAAVAEAVRARDAEWHTRLFLEVPLGPALNTVISYIEGLPEGDGDTLDVGALLVMLRAIRKEKP